MTSLDTYRHAAGDLAGEARAASEVFAMLATFVIRTDQDRDLIAECVRRFRATRETLDGRRKSVADPLRKAIDEINSWFKPAIQTCTEGERIGKQKLQAYRDEQAERNRQAIQAAAQAPTAAVATQALATIQPATLPDRTHTRKMWKWEIANETLVPREVMSIDPGKVQAWLRAGVTEIPGLRIWQEETVVVR